MILSNVDDKQSLLYLGVVGPLDARTTGLLVEEYYDRVRSGLHRCLLDLSRADQITGDGLGCLRRLAISTHADGVRLDVRSEGSRHASDIEAEVERCLLNRVNGAA